MSTSICETVHDEYALRLPQWARARAAREGEDAVHLAGDTYLPRLGDQTDDEYEAYLLRARWFNAFSKTISGYTGLVMRSPVNYTAPESFDRIADNIDRTGADITAYFKKALEEVLEMGRAGTLVDYTKIKDGATLADAAAVNARVYWTLYKTEDIRDWDFTDGTLDYLVLRERVSHRDEFYKTWGKEERFRVLELVNGVYTQSVYVKGEDGDQLTGEPVTPLFNNATMAYVPFEIHQPDFTPTINPPVLIDLLNLNYSHYRLKADHAHALHFVALPTPWITGLDPADPLAPSSIGPQKLWIIAEAEANVGMLEYTGAGIASIQAELSSMEEQMAMLGARLLMSEAPDATATAAKIKSIGETADLTSIVEVLDTQFNTVLAIAIEWASGTAVDPEFSVNKNFVPFQFDAQMFLALVKAWQDGAYDFETLTWNLQKGEIVDANRSVEELADAVQAETDNRLAAEAEAVAAAAPEPVVEPAAQEE